MITSYCDVCGKVEETLVELLLEDGRKVLACPACESELKALDFRFDDVLFNDMLN